MRCVCCNKLLTDLESTRKHAETGQYLDMCNKCLDFCPEIPYTERSDLQNSADYDAEYHDLDSEGFDGESDSEDDLP